MNKRVLLILLSGVLAIVLIVVFVVTQVTKKPVTVTLVVTPAAAKVVLDGKNIIKPGSQYIQPGKHSVTTSFTGFSTASQSFTVSSNASSPQKVNVVLNPSSQTGTDYLNSHPADQKAREAVIGSAFSQTTKTIQDTYPIIKQLPYVGPANSYRIDYEPAPGDDSSSNQIEILITYYQDGADQAAVQWIQDQGYDPSKLPIAYTNDTTDTSQTQVDNPYTN